MAGEPTFVAFDVETTGLHPLCDRVVEVGALRFGLGGPREAYESLVNPERPIPEDAVAVHGIDEAAVAGAPLFAGIAEDLRRLMDGAVLVAHNASFDASFLLCECHRAGIDPPEIGALDSCTLARLAFPGMDRYSLDHLVEKLGLDRSRGHRALPDAAASADLFLRSLRRLGVEGAGDLGRFYAAHAPVPIADLGYRPCGSLPEGYERIERALRDGTGVSIVYADRFGNTSSREVVPLRVASAQGVFMMEAHCLLREGTRCFRLDRIKAIRDSDGNVVGP
ncbi:MAG: exonuclease domain-containing protein [Candidatus Eisenbacteria bacterium]